MVRWHAAVVSVLVLACLVGTVAAGSAAGAPSLYVANHDGGNVFQYDVGASGLLTPKAPATVAAGAGARDPAISPDGRSAYVVNAGSDNIAQYDIGAGGLLTPKVPATVPTGDGPIEVALTPDGRSAYVPNSTDDNVSMYDVGAAGHLTPKPPGVVAAGDGPRQLSVSADGRSVNDVGAGGQLSLKTPATVATGMSPFGVAFTADGRSAYVSNGDSDSVSQYDVGAGGLLAAKTPTAVAAGDDPSGLALTPEQGPLAAFSAAAAPAGLESGFDGSTSTDPDNTIGRYDWDFGDGTSAANGGPRPHHAYASPGTYTVTLRVTDQAGCTGALVFTGQMAYCAPSAAAVSHTLTIPAAADRAAPNVSAFSLTRRRFRASRAPTALLARRTRAGSRFRFRLSEKASVTIAIERSLPGRRARRRAGRCRAPSPGLRRNRRCTRYRAAGRLRRAGLGAGARQIGFSGRLGRRALRPGSYRATIRATDEAGNRSARRRARFTIVRR